MDTILSEEVRSALAEGLPLVAMESSVLAQGLPYPANRDCQKACEAAVRSEGAVPALVALLKGSVRCGLSPKEVEALAQSEGRPWKVGARDLAPAVAGQADGGTTVSATCTVAGALRIPIFTTGGIGGVHPGGLGDVSEDLHALARFPGMVVCSGAKSVLDLPRTLDALESLGVLVVGYQTRQFPAFYVRSSGLELAHQVDDVNAAAELLHIHRDRLQQAGALLLCVPPPPSVALAQDELAGALAAADAEATRLGVRGQALTPWLLQELVRRTGGRTLRANVGLLEQNARVAAQVAVRYASRARA